MDRAESTFLWFDGAPRGQHAFPSCSVTKSGSMTFGTEAIRALGEPDAVRLGWDPQARRIGVMSGEQGQPGALALRVQKGTGGKDTGSRTIFARAFLLYHGILPSQNNRFRLEEVDSGVFALELDSPLPKKSYAKRSDGEASSLH